MKDNKVCAYLGFAIKSGKIIFGYDKLFESKKMPNLTIVCSTLNEKMTNKVLEFCANHNIKYIKLKALSLNELIGRNSKVLSVCDNNFSKIICNELEELNGSNKIREGNIGK